MKITPEQAEKLYNFIYTHIDAGCIEHSKINDLLAEIEEANKPLEIKWCVTHECSNGHNNVSHTFPNCDIRTFVEKK